MKPGVLFLIAIMGCGCASTTPGVPARPLTAGTHGTTLGVTSRLLEEASSPRLLALEFTFENRTDRWRTVKSASLVARDAKLRETVLVPVGAALYSWQAAMAQRRAVRDANRKTALELLLLGGFVSAELSGDEHPGAGLAGSLLVLGAGSALVVQRFRERAHQAESVARVPDSHLLAGPFAVPPGLFTKKWIVLYTTQQEGPDELQLVLSYTADDGRIRQLLIDAGNEPRIGRHGRTRARALGRH